MKDIFLKTDKFGNSLTPNNYEDPDLNMVFTGASNAFGVGSSDNENTIPSLIQTEFAKKNIKVNFYNLAIRGVQSFQEFQRLYEFLSLNEIKIDTVISLSVRNDADFASYHDDLKYSLLPKYNHELSKKINKMFSHELFVNNSIYYKNLLTNKFYLFDVFYKNIKNLTENKKYVISKTPQKVNYHDIEKKVSITAKNYDLMNKVSNMFNANYILIPQPLVSTKNITDNEKKCFYFDKKSMEYQVTFYEKLFEKLKNKKYFYNISNIFDHNDEDIYVDSVHFNDRGAKIIAQKMYEIINENYN